MDSIFFLKKRRRDYGLHHTSPSQYYSELELDKYVVFKAVKNMIFTCWQVDLDVNVSIDSKYKYAYEQNLIQNFTLTNQLEHSQILVQMTEKIPQQEN